MCLAVDLVLDLDVEHRADVLVLDHHQDRRGRGPALARSAGGRVSDQLDVVVPVRRAERSLDVDVGPARIFALSSGATSNTASRAASIVSRTSCGNFASGTLT